MCLADGRDETREVRERVVHARRVDGRTERGEPEGTLHVGSG